MKRSHAIALGATGILLAGAWLGSGKQSMDNQADGQREVDALLYASVQDCITANVLSRESCEAEFASLEQNHVASAPKFADQSTCEAQYGAASCKPATFNGASVFVPAMIGMLVANHLSNRRQAQALYPQQANAQPCAPGQTPLTQPGCVAPRGASSGSGGGWRSYSTSSGGNVSRNFSNSASSVLRVPANVAAAPAARSTLGPVTSRSSAPSAASTVSRGGFGSTGVSSSSSS